MHYKDLIKYLGFIPKENTSGIYQKRYAGSNGYCIEVDAENEKINYGTLIKAESSTTLNFAQNENWVVLECVNRLLEKGYQPQNIVLEKTWATGHGTSGRLDILVTRNDGSSYLMIECKVWGAEFEKEQKRIDKDGGLFTYFQQDKNADVLMLYTSDHDKSEVRYKNVIIKIEEDYRQTGNVKDFYERWNKLPKTNGIFDDWVTPYEFQSKALIKKDLKVLKQEDSSFIFNRFLEILRHNVVSDKPNAFNKIFTLFLCKIVDENRNKNEQLHFQWLEGEDNHISFQKRLTDLYRRGMKELLDKKVSDVSDEEFDTRFQQVEERYRDEIKDILTEIRLKKNNEFAIKEVFDDASFQENAKVVKEVVELLQKYQIRYTYRQQFLSDFFELLLTTGLKQESGQFFTPVPIARFIIKSLPLQEITAKKIVQGNRNDLLPTIIDYAAGSGHFITESMEEVQKFIDKLKDLNQYTPETRRQIEGFQRVQFDWAEKYVYAIEKDYRLVKTAKVSCYLHGDGLAKVIHGDGLGDFATSTEFKDLLKETDRTYLQDNKQFDVIISNPPYSVSAFKGLMDEEKSKKAFDLYSRLTDQSSEIECLFIERTKQLLKDGGVAGIILPSSILSNTGIYTQTREIILKYFDILAIAELGSNTFMATGTNTVTLFLRRRNNADAYNIEEAVKKCFTNQQDLTINGIEKPISKYVSHVWGTVSFDDYKTLLQKSPNDKMQQHEIYQEYTKKIKAKNEQELWNNILALEQEKLLYFIIAYPQKLVLVKTGEKDGEKRFLGYEFSNRRGSEGIHPIQRSKTIDDCTQLYDAGEWENPEKASTYIYKAFKGEFDAELPENLNQNISYQNLVDMLNFDRVDFEKTISLAVKKKANLIEISNSKCEIKTLGEVASFKRGPFGGSLKKEIFVDKGYKVYEQQHAINKDFSIGRYFISEEKFEEMKGFELVSGDLIMSCSGTIGKIAVFPEHAEKGIINQALLRLRPLSNISTSFLKILLEVITNKFVENSHGAGLQNVASVGILKDIKIPLPSKDIQEKIVSEIEALEKREESTIKEIENLKDQISNSINDISDSKGTKLENIALMLKRGKSAKYGNSNIQIIKSGQARGYKNFDFTSRFFVENSFVLDERQLRMGDILINSTGVGTAGRITLFNLEGKFVVDSHITILRPNINIATPSFVLYSLANIGFKAIEKMATGQSGQIELSLSIIGNIKIPLPDLDIQKQIVLQIESIESQIADLEKQIEQIPTQKEQILKKYLE